MSDLNRKLTANFTLREFVYWADKSSMSIKDKALSNRLAEESYQTVINEIEKAAIGLQFIRDFVNSREFECRLLDNEDHISLTKNTYKARKPSHFGIVITSAYRPKKWELHRGRSGASQHTNGHAVDFKVIPIGKHELTLPEIDEVNRAVYRFLNQFHSGGVAIAYGAKRYVSFIHVDYRGKKARWTY